MNHRFLVFILFYFIVIFTNAQQVNIDSIFKSYTNLNQYIDYDMHYNYSSIPDSILSKKESILNASIGKDFYRYYENGVENIFIDGYYLKINHKLKKVFKYNSKPISSQFDINEFKKILNQLNVKIDIKNTSPIEENYFFKFPNADTTACIMTLDANTKLIKKYQYKMWAQSDKGDLYLKVYDIQYKNYRMSKINKIKSSDYFIIKNDKSIVLSGKCSDYELKIN